MKFLSFFLFSSVYASSISYNKNIYKKIYQYKKIHRKFSKQSCSPGVDFKYLKLLRNYRGDGVYIPLVKDRIDRDAIKSNMKLFPKKKAYILSIKKKLKRNKRLEPIQKDIKKIQKLINKALKFQYENKGSSQIIVQLDKAYRNLVKKVYYLKSFNYPNNHLKNRIMYEEHLGNYDTESIKKKNRIYFYRKIIEDGAFDKNHKKSDLYTRSTLDTIQLSFNKKPKQLDEKLRYNIEWVLDRIQNSKERSTKKQIERMTEWYERTNKLEKRYKKILKISRNDEKKIIANKNAASKELKDFVYQKQADVFRFWRKQSQIDKALYVLETILFNEVGSIDGYDALERQDVAKIVLNRFKNPAYNKIQPYQEIARKLNFMEYKDETILGTLFRKGEFSFTYFYIPSVVKIFCPDMSKRGQSLRAKNLKISLKAIKNYNYLFGPVRYFSRVSMLGKVDMAKVWSDFLPIPERAGFIYPNQRRVYSKFKKGNYRILYSFIDPKEIKFTVIEMNKRKYSVKNFPKKPVFYKYRSPHLFTYFEKK